VVYKISCPQLMIFVFFFIEKIQSHALSVPPLSHTFSCIPTKYNLYLANSLGAVVSDHNLYRLQTFIVPNLIFMFHCLGFTKRPIKDWGTCIHFLTRPVFRMSCCCNNLTHLPSLRTTPCRMSETAYSMYSHLPSILGPFLHKLRTRHVVVTGTSHGFRKLKKKLKLAWI